MLGYIENSPNYQHSCNCGHCKALRKSYRIARRSDIEDILRDGLRKAGWLGDETGIAKKNVPAVVQSLLALFGITVRYERLGSRDWILQIDPGTE